MPRIVKSEVKPTLCGYFDGADGNYIAAYAESDTVLITPDWRLENHTNPYPLHYAGIAPCGHDAAGYENGLHDGFEAGFSAALKALGEI